MATPTPAEKSNALIKEMNAMVEHGINYDRLNEIEIEARKIQDFSFVPAKLLLGVIAGMRRDKAQIKTQFDAAIRAGGEDAIVLANYANALSNIGDIEGAIVNIDKAVYHAPGDIAFLRRAVDLHLEGYDLEGAAIHMNSLRALGVDPTPKLPQEVLAAIHRIFSESEVDWHAAALRLSRSYDAILPYPILITGMSLNIHDGTILHRMELEGDVEMVAKAESAMLDAIADCPYDRVDDVIHFSCIAE